MRKFGNRFGFRFVVVEYNVSWVGEFLNKLSRHNDDDVESRRNTKRH